MAAVVVGQAVSTTIRPSVAPRGWLVAPWFDAILIANVAWPLLLLWQWRDGFEGRAGLQFWQIYFVTTPHRWITLAIVFLDRERFHQRPRVFLGLLVSIVVGVTVVRTMTGALTCLLTIDYLWNAWHFAAQHQGIYRIYGRLNDASHGWHVIVERWGLRLFLLYVTLRVAVSTWSDSTWGSTLQVADTLAPAIPLALLIRDCCRYRHVATGRIVYLLSLSVLYLSLLWAVHNHRPGMMLSLTTASALFHALEYLSIVSWMVHKRSESLQQAMGWMGMVATQWAGALCGFMVILGASGCLIEQHWMEQWLFLNVIVAFLHYAYDGLIWRHRPAGRSQISVASVSAFSTGRP